MMLLMLCGGKAAPAEPTGNLDFKLPANHLDRFQFSQVCMGVATRITVYALNEDSATTACKAAFDRIADLEEMMSDYRPTSELTKLCTKAGGPPVQVSRELLFVLTRARVVSDRSNGAFDVTVGPLVGLWRAARKAGRLPDESELRAAKELVGWRNIRIDHRRGTVRLAKKGMKLDFGGIAKGYACDEAVRVLKRCGIRSAMVEMGGDIVVSAAPPGARGWVIEIPNSGLAQCRVALANAAVSSSGDTEQFIEIGGVRYSHILDPRTGLGLTNRTAVTVVAHNGIMSDSFSTAISVSGEDGARELTKGNPGIRVYIRRALQ